MSKIAVITDSNAHITPQEAEKLGISVVPDQSHERRVL